jgi:hypothetical protein
VRARAAIPRGRYDEEESADKWAPPASEKDSARVADQAGPTCQCDARRVGARLCWVEENGPRD